MSNIWNPWLREYASGLPEPVGLPTFVCVNDLIIRARNGLELYVGHPDPFWAPFECFASIEDYVIVFMDSIGDIVAVKMANEKDTEEVFNAVEDRLRKWNPNDLS